jgi:hypothetical protein
MLERYRSRETTTTSLRQGRSREGGSEGSRRQSCEPTNRNVIEGRDSWVSWHTTTKPVGSGSTVNDAVVQRQFTVLSGEVCPGAAWSAREVGLRASPKELDHPPIPTAIEAARLTVTFSRTGQKSAEAIVAASAVKGRTVSYKEEP